MGGQERRKKENTKCACARAPRGEEKPSSGKSRNSSLGARKGAMPSASGRARKARFGHLQRDTRQHMQRTTRSGGRRSKPTRLLPEQHGGGPSTAKRRDFVEGPQQQLKSAQLLQGHRAAKKASRGEGSACLFLFLFFFCLFWFCFALVLFGFHFFFLFFSCLFLQLSASRPGLSSQGRRRSRGFSAGAEKGEAKGAKRQESRNGTQARNKGRRGQISRVFLANPTRLPTTFPRPPRPSEQQKALTALIESQNGWGGKGF